MWRCQRAVYIPADPETTMHRPIWNSTFFDRFRQRHLATIEGHDPVAAHVPHLLGARRPDTVSGFIIAIVILALDLVVIAWPFAHIGEKVIKAASPALTDSDASTTPVLVLLVR
jgi:hypothetical protein